MYGHPDIYGSSLTDIGILVEQYWKGREVRGMRRET